MAEDVADLDKIGGLQPIIAELDRSEEELRTTAAWVLGKACQNNLVVQKQVCLKPSRGIQSPGVDKDRFILARQLL